MTITDWAVVGGCTGFVLAWIVDLVKTKIAKRRVRPLGLLFGKRSGR